MNSLASVVGATQGESSVAVAGIVMVTVIVAMIIWQIAVTWRARMLAGREEAYRKLSEEAVQSQQAVLLQLDSTATDLVDVRKRIGEIERLLKQVE